MVSAKAGTAGIPEPRPLFFSGSAGMAPADRPGPARRSGLLACVDDRPAKLAVLPHARAVADALDLTVILGRVIETPRFRSPADPIEWKVRCDRHRADLVKLAAQDAEGEGMASVILSGAPAEELSIWGHENGATLLALSRRGLCGQPGLGSTAQRLLQRGTASLLLVPPMETPTSVHYRRILVPIDGSARSESVLPIAARIARLHGAEILLAHVVPQLEIVDEAIPQLRKLRGELDAHNERNGREHLETLRERLAGDGLAVRAIVAGPGDPRTILPRIADEQKVDLIVLSSHGRTGLPDAYCGSVAEYLAGHASIPLLLVRPNLRCRFAEPSQAPRGLVRARSL